MYDKASDKARIPRTLAGSIGTGLLAVLMVGVVTFGANSIRPLTAGGDADASSAPAARDDGGATAARDDGDGDAATTNEDAFSDGLKRAAEFTGGDDAVTEDGDKPAEEEPQKEEPADEPADEPKPEPDPTDEPKPEPDPTDKPKPEPTDPPKEESGQLGLEAWAKDDGKVKLSWSKFGGDGFEYYKVVRSEDATVTWPLGAGDELVAAIGDRFATYLYDQPPCGHEFHYRVFAVRHAEEGYKVLAASNMAGAFVACHEEKPDEPAEPAVMGFDAWVTDAGEVKLAWEQCSSESFVYYKVVRSQTNEHPTYPLQAGDELLAAIGDPGQTVFKDADVEPGQTWFYRVLSFAEGGVLLGATPARAVTVE